MPPQQAVYLVTLGLQMSACVQRQARSGVSPGHCEIGAAIYRTLGLVPPNWVRLLSPVWPTHQGILTDAEELNAPAGAPQGEAAAHFGSAARRGLRSLLNRARLPLPVSDHTKQAATRTRSAGVGFSLTDQNRLVR